MFSFEKELANVDTLYYGFNLAQLWYLREELNLIIADLEELKNLSIKICDKKELLEAEKKLFYLNRNVSIVEETMVKKEAHIFEFLICDEFCLN